MVCFSRSYVTTGISIALFSPVQSLPRHSHVFNCLIRNIFLPGHSHTLSSKIASSYFIIMPGKTFRNRANHQPVFPPQKHRPGGYLHSRPYPIPFYTEPQCYNVRRRKPMTLKSAFLTAALPCKCPMLPRKPGNAGLRVGMPPSRRLCPCAYATRLILIAVA